MCLQYYMCRIKNFPHALFSANGLSLIHTLYIFKTIVQIHSPPPPPLPPHCKYKIILSYVTFLGKARISQQVVKMWRKVLKAGINSGTAAFFFFVPSRTDILKGTSLLSSNPRRVRRSLTSDELFGQMMLKESPGWKVTEFSYVGKVNRRVRKKNCMMVKKTYLIKSNIAHSCIISVCVCVCVCGFVIASNQGRKCDTLLSDRGRLKHGDGPHPER